MNVPEGDTAVNTTYMSLPNSPTDIFDSGKVMLVETVSCHMMMSAPYSTVPMDTS